mmetsp:Transcript_17978/g.41456  ORF Transcript_17978/g.41456 Transcript_17978/m.41456 type:complete len:116 (-) Transcript_17978:137-484(-)
MASASASATTATATTTATAGGLPHHRRRRGRSGGAARTEPLTNTNTDLLCANGSLLSPSTWMYRFNLWTGLYMMNPCERVVFHLVGWSSLTVSLLYVCVFWKGFAEGFREERQQL